MTTYAEKADISAKAVKVIDSVTKRSQLNVAINYADRAFSRICGVGIFFAVEHKLKDCPDTDLVESVSEALNKKNAWLDKKPRYVWRKGKWVNKDDILVVKKDAYGPYLSGPPSTAKERNREAQARDYQNMGMSKPSFGRGNPYVGLNQSQSGIGGLF